MLSFFPGQSATIYERTTVHVCGAADAGAGVLTGNTHALCLVYKQRNAHACVVVLLWECVEDIE